MTSILAYFKYVENYGKTPKSNPAIITAIARLFFGVFMTLLLAYFDYVENFSKTPNFNPAIITAIVRLYFGHNKIFWSYGQYRWKNKFQEKGKIWTKTTDLVIFLVLA